MNPSNNITITPELISSIHSALDKGLAIGIGNPVDGEMCIEALICAKLGLPHSDNPPCVHKEVRDVKISLNDSNWSSNTARAEGMRKLAIAQLNSQVFEDGIFFNALKLNSTKRILPYLIQNYYDRLERKDEKLLDYKKKFEELVVLDNALWEEFYNLYYNNNNNNNNNNYYLYYYYYDLYYNNNNYYLYYNHCHRDEYLLLIADVILQTLIELKSPGCKFL